MQKKFQPSANFSTCFWLIFIMFFIKCNRLVFTKSFIVTSDSNQFFCAFLWRVSQKLMILLAFLFHSSSLIIEGSGMVSSVVKIPGSGGSSTPTASWRSGCFSACCCACTYWSFKGQLISKWFLSKIRTSPYLKLIRIQRYQIFRFSDSQFVIERAKSRNLSVA